MGGASITVSEASPKRGSGGRPTREEAERRDAHMVAVAARLFMDHGFDGTSIDAVAQAAGVSKPTLYARYRDKRALFKAVLEERIQAWLVPLASAARGKAPGAEPRDAQAVLDEVSRTLLAHVHTPGSAALTRCIVAQAIQFPDLARLAYEEGWLKAVAAVAQLLEALVEQGQLEIADPEIAADLFLNLVIGRSSRLALYGIEVDATAQEKRRRAAVALFLAGTRPSRA